MNSKFTSITLLWKTRGHWRYASQAACWGLSEKRKKKKDENRLIQIS